MASDCEHTDKPHYSNGMCQSCYLAQYYLKRKAKRLAKVASMQAKTETMDADDEEILKIIEHQ
jgi:hypothetical protein